MAYSLSTAWLRKRTLGAKLEEVNIGNVLLRTLFKTYSTGFIVLTNPSLLKPQRLDFFQLQQLEVNLNNVSFNSWLLALGNRALPTVDYLPEEESDEESRTVTCFDAWAMGLNINAVHDTYHPDVAVDILLKTSLQIESDQETLSNKSEKFCVAVNGYLHRKEKMGDSIRVRSGRRTFDHSGFENVTFLNFSNLGGIEEISFDDNTINGSDGIEMYKTVLLETGINLEGKSVLFSLCGLIFGEHNLVRVIDRNSGIIKLDLFKLDFFRMFQTIHNHLDLTELELHLPDPFTANILKSTLQLERVVRALLKMDQTFAIIVGTEAIEIDYEKPLDLDLYGKYNESRNIPYPLVDSYGRLMPYRKFREGAIVAYSVGIDHYQFAADKRAKSDEVLHSNSNGWWGDRFKETPNFMKIRKV